MVGQTYLPQGGASDGQQWMPNYMPPSHTPGQPLVGILGSTSQIQITPQDVQKLQEEMQQKKNLQQEMQSLLSSSGSIISSTSYGIFDLAIHYGVSCLSCTPLSIKREADFKVAAVASTFSRGESHAST